MKSDNKYYTPSIEEFHVGFEYEVFNKTEKYLKGGLTTFPIDTKLDWTVFTFPDPYVGYEIPEIFKQYTLRVKYLDREDIQSLGWTYVGRSIDDWYTIEGMFEIGKWTSYEVQMHCDYRNKDRRMFINAIDRGEDCSIFKGTIKNKSELRKLMEQLNIKN